MTDTCALLVREHESSKGFTAHLPFARDSQQVAVLRHEDAIQSHGAVQQIIIARSTHTILLAGQYIHAAAAQRLGDRNGNVDVHVEA